MQILRFGPRFLCIAVSATVAACAAPDEPRISASAEEPPGAREPRAPTFASPGEQDGSLAQLTAEVRQLRLAVEELARSQTETRALEASLSTHQSRMLQTEERLEIVRRQIDSAAARSEDIEARLASLAEERSRATAPDARTQIDDAIGSFRAELEAAARELQQARSREGELSRALQLEEARWNELISRLENLSGR